MKRALLTGGTTGAAILILIVTWMIPAGATSPQPLTGIRSLTGDGRGYCAVLTGDNVDCWGRGQYGELGNGIFYTTGNEGSAVAVAVEGVGGVGTLSGVGSLVSDGDHSFCALLTSGTVDCWGFGNAGELGDGRIYVTSNLGSAVPVVVKGVGGVGTLSGVASLVSDHDYGYCARLTSGSVACWGSGLNGALGNSSGTQAHVSDVPVAVKGVGSSGTLSGVTSLVSDHDYGYCARLTSGSVACWGYNHYGELGDGMYYPLQDSSAFPVAVKGLAGVGSLGSVATVFSDGWDSYCARLTSGKIDCWGEDASGQLGNGASYPDGSNVPVAVKGVGSVGTLNGVASLASEGGSGPGYCALLTSGDVDCWGQGSFGQLGNGTFYTSATDYGSAVPVAVEGPGGVGRLGSVASIDSEGYGYCARLSSGDVDCWGVGVYGDLGNGSFYTSGNEGSAVPVAVERVGGVRTLGGATSLVSDGGTEGGYCALVTGGRAACWGFGIFGDLGNGTFYTTGNQGSAVPVAVIT